MSHSERPWYHRVKWVPTTTLIIIPVLFLLTIPWVPKNRRILGFAWLYGFHSGLCITAGTYTHGPKTEAKVWGFCKLYKKLTSKNIAGYHRLWSHKSYNASWPLRLYLAIFGAAAMEGPIIWWAREHRLHHRYTDTTEDPYNIKKGFLHAHILWMVLKQRPRTRRVDISDLEADPIVMWQSRHFPLLAIVMGWIFPTIICGILFQDWLGGFVYGAILKMILTHQSTFFINSLAHYLGDRPYDDRTTPRDNFFVAVLTLGEGYHNFHHIFPSDYRNGVRWYQYDCTKWAIALWEKVGLAYDLKRVEQSEIERARLQELQKGLDSEMKSLPQAKPEQSLPFVNALEFKRLVEGGRMLIAVEGALHDVGDFIADHPGGLQLIKAFVGKDATNSFNGGIYGHSKVARNILSLTRVAILREQTETTDYEENSKIPRDAMPARYLETR